MTTILIIDGDNLIHKPTGSLLCTLHKQSHCNIEPLVQEIDALIAADKTANRPIIDVARKSRKLQAAVKAVSAITRCWSNSDLERLVGSFWRDREAAESKLVKLGMNPYRASSYSKLMTRSI